MHKTHSKVAAALVGLVMFSGVSVGMAGSASADETPTVTTSRGETIFKTYRACLTKGNKLAQKGKLTTFRCKAVKGGYALFYKK